MTGAPGQDRSVWKDQPTRGAGRGKAHRLPDWAIWPPANCNKICQLISQNPMGIIFDDGRYFFLGKSISVFNVAKICMVVSHQSARRAGSAERAMAAAYFGGVPTVTGMAA
jgi:hypothetical protein